MDLYTNINQVNQSNSSPHSSGTIQLMVCSFKARCMNFLLQLLIAVLHFPRRDRQSPTYMHSHDHMSGFTLTLSTSTQRNNHREQSRRNVCIIQVNDAMQITNTDPTPRNLCREIKKQILQLFMLRLGELKRPRPQWHGQSQPEMPQSVEFQRHDFPAMSVSKEHSKKWAIRVLTQCRG